MFTSNDIVLFLTIVLDLSLLQFLEDWFCGVLTVKF